MKFLNNWTIDIEQIPKYLAFKAPMNLVLNRNILRAFIDSKADYINSEQLVCIQRILDDINKHTNILTIKHSQPYDIGRFYCNNSPIVLSRHIKHTLFSSLGWIDLDMIKGHPTILYNIAKNNGIKLLHFKIYIEQPDVVLSKIQSHYIDEVPNITKEDVKDIFSILIYGGSYNTWLKQMAKSGKIIETTQEHEFIEMFQINCRTLIDLVYNSNEAIVNKVRGDTKSEYELKNRTMSFFCGIIENEIIYTCYKLLLKEGVIANNSVALEYDGLCFKRPDKTDEELVELIVKINDNIKKKTGLDVKMAWKKYSSDKIHQDIIDIANKMSDEQDNTQNSMSFESVSKNFEKTHCKIINKGIFLKEIGDEHIPMSKQHITTSYEHLQYDKIVIKNGVEELIKKNFISDWVRNNPDQRCFEDIGCYPTGLTCPDNIYNTWVDFPMESIKEYEHKEEELQRFLKHIDILCGNDLVVSDYIKKWVAQMIQYPHVKSICPTFISNEGAGKGIFLKAIGNMIGTKKVFQTSNPSRDIWGEFNGIMANSFFINLNELTKKDTLDSEGKIKELIKDPEISINTKGINAYKINSYHRFMITSNKEDPISTSKDDRRKIIIRCSDENCGNHVYGKSMNDMLDDVNVIKTIYEYFKSIPDMDKFVTIPLPVTDYQQNLTELSVSPVEQWLKAFVLQNSSEKEINMNSSDIYSSFNKWVSKNCPDYKLTNVQFGVRLKNLKVTGVSKGKPTKKGETKTFDIVELLKHFKLECVLDIDDIDNKSDSGCEEKEL